MNQTKLVTLERQGDIAHIRLNRPDKHNAINDELLLQLEALLDPVDEGIRVIVLTGEGDNFCSGLDLAEHQARAPFEVVRGSQLWHRVFSKFNQTGIPVVAVLKGAVIGGGLELAACAHVRVAESNTFFRLPEGRHGIFVGGGASVRVANIIGSGRMTEMMLTGRTLDVDDGEGLGLVHYRVGDGEGESKAMALAATIAENSRLSNWAMVSAMSRIDSMSMDDGLFTESLVAGMTQTNPEVQARIGQFLNRKKTL